MRIMLRVDGIWRASEQSIIADSGYNKKEGKKKTPKRDRQKVTNGKRGRKTRKIQGKRYCLRKRRGNLKVLESFQEIHVDLLDKAPKKNLAGKTSFEVDCRSREIHDA